jgi:thiosulfate dehydrogenase
MPLGTTFDVPVLTDEQAYDVAGYIASQDRPKKPNLDEDFPIRLQKPIDTPYGPYADGFPAEQHPSQSEGAGGRVSNGACGGS